ncbi:MAG: PAS domain-containing sensor histidine kinase [Ruminococcaceae bacterium]|nr:PAS domain-containing sensor histidine kinase [Oscillospiraceae bacterium]
MKSKQIIKDILITVSTLVLCFALCLVIHNLLQIEEHITTIFVFAVFLISLTTNGYVYGIIASVIGTVAVNYAFTFPFFEVNFLIFKNLVSGIVMITISILTSALTTKVRRHEMIKAESEKERMRANLLRAVSHDLRTPLTTIYSSTSALLEEKNLSDEQKENMLKGVKEDSEWLVRMVENLLSITKIDSGNVEIIKAPTVLDELIDSVIQKFKKRYPDQNINIDIPDDIVIIPMDSMLIEQVLVNILENAVQHAKGMTELALKVFILGNNAIFEIKDNGCGISHEKLDKIFTGLYNTKPEMVDSQKRNAGIGLSVCATIIKAHGGDIKAENLKSGGAVFRFSLDIEDNTGNM